jgi:putative SOS response-associated peptidase YedK
MCANYKPTRKDLLQVQYGATVEREYSDDIKPADFAPIIVRHRESGERVAELARFGLLPPFAKDTKFCWNTYNARSETVAEKPSYRTAWAKSHFCLVPASHIVEPCYETGKAIRWAIGMRDESDFAIAGMWAWWRNPETGLGEASFTMLTINADEHGLMHRFHKPGDEKRMPYIVAPSEYDAWLGATPDEARAMLTQYPAGLMTSCELGPYSRKAKT